MELHALKKTPKQRTVKGSILIKRRNVTIKEKGEIGLGLTRNWVTALQIIYWVSQIYRISVLHLPEYTGNLYLSKCSTDLR